MNTDDLPAYVVTESGGPAIRVGNRVYPPFGDENGIRWQPVGCRTKGRISIDAIRDYFGPGFEWVLPEYPKERNRLLLSVLTIRRRHDGSGESA
jgi:hypothetical protein